MAAFKYSVNSGETQSDNSRQRGELGCPYRDTKQRLFTWKCHPAGNAASAGFEDDGADCGSVQGVGANIRIGLIAANQGVVDVAAARHRNAGKDSYVVDAEKSHVSNSWLVATGCFIAKATGFFSWAAVNEARTETVPGMGFLASLQYSESRIHGFDNKSGNKIPSELGRLGRLVSEFAVDEAVGTCGPVAWQQTERLFAHDYAKAFDQQFVLAEEALHQDGSLQTVRPYDPSLVHVSIEGSPNYDLPYGLPRDVTFSGGSLGSTACRLALPAHHLSPGQLHDAVQLPVVG